MFQMCKLESGKMTVEAAFLLPIVCFILVLILWFFLFCYEDGIAASVLREEVEKTADVIKTNGDIETGEYDISLLNQRKLTYLLFTENSQMERQCSETIRKKIATLSLFGTQTNVTIRIKQGEIWGRVKANFPIPIIGSAEIAGISFFCIDQSVRKELHIPAEKIRRWQQIE